ncbi:GNAT family N-acetyltransferase [Novosphingobium sp.]|uniref:GNAT family N-acetyltransferase n=1 Tax=Novosphingobium sp. TaxID=1874826 RepID=UPI0031DEA246
MIIRQTVPEDLPGLRDLFMQSRRTAFVWEPSSAQALDDFDSQTEGEMQMIALEGGTVAGFVSVWEADDFIHHLHVHPAFLRRGIGQVLLRALPDWPARPYRLKCVSRNTAALAFYAANGFMPIGQGRADGQDYILLESRADLDR